MSKPECNETAPESVSVETRTASKARTSVLADGTPVDPDYYQSKHYILSQLEQRKASEKTSMTETDKKPAKEGVDKTTTAMLKSGAISEDDGWLLASMELAIRNPFCIANHPAQEQVKFYQKVFLMSSIFMFMVACATLLWTWWWGMLIQGGTKPIMPCRGNGDTFGKVRLCNDTSSEWNTELGDDGCDESAPLSICVEDSCVNSVDDELRNCWYVAAFVMVIFAAYMLLLFRRDQAGKGLLTCACFIEGILGGAGTLHYDSSIFLEFFTYLTCTSVLALIVFSKYCQKNMPEWEKLPNQVGSTRITVPDVETVVHGAVKKAYFLGAAIVTGVSLIWHFGTPIRLTGGSTIAFFLAIFTLWLSVGWLIREISWTQHKYDADQYVNMCISFHVDLYCIFILFTIFVFFLLNDSIHQGPIACAPTCCSGLAHQGERCARFACGVPGKSQQIGAAADGTVPAGDSMKSSKKGQSQHVEKEVETQEAWRRRKAINAGCAFGILALAGMSFFAPQVSFAVSLGICMGLPFFRAVQNRESKEEDHSNV